jgi:hypothetical protein
MNFVIFRERNLRLLAELQCVFIMGKRWFVVATVIELQLMIVLRVRIVLRVAIVVV